MIEYLLYYIFYIALVAAVVYFVVSNLKLKAPKAVTALITLLIASPLFLGYFYLNYFTSIPEVLVPDLHGLLLEQAERVLGSYGLKSRLAGNLYDTSFPEGVVVGQRPEAGTNVKKGRTINVLTSSGQRKVTVPNLLGRPVSQIEAVLTANGLVLGEVELETAANMSPGLVVSQQPLPEDEVDSGAKISITISTLEGKALPKVEKQQGGFRLW